MWKPAAFEQGRSNPSLSTTDPSCLDAGSHTARRRESRSHSRFALGELLTGAFLFFATAAFVLWQNLHLTVLWDLSYILENATRIALGQHPYRDFPFPYAPLTFVMQAAIIRLFGRAVIHHYLYASLSAGCATLLTWRILRRQLAATALPPRLTAFLLASPLIFLGTGSIFPHPFYDSDCTLAILLCLWLLLRLESKGWPARSTFGCGALLIAPLFIKQNTGLAFLVAAVAAIGWVAPRGSIGSALSKTSPSHIRQLRADVGHRPGSEVGHRRSLRAAALLLGGAAASLAAALALIQHTCGLGNYYHWTMQFAASRRLPGAAAMLGIYLDPALLGSFAAFACGLAILRRACPTFAAAFATKVGHAEPGAGFRRTAWRWIACALLSLPFLWVVAALFLRGDDSDRAEALLHLWPVLLAASLVFALWQLPRAKSFAQLLPLILLAVIHGAFLSQQLWGSTYALWPLLMLLMASLLAALASRVNGAPHLPSLGSGSIRASEFSAAPLTAFTIAASLSLLIAGGHYALSHERLSYADLSGETLHHSTLPALRGLAVRGDWLPDFEELVAYTDQAIPRGDAILAIPGEDLFYFTTGRTPRFPVVMMDNTVNPYSASELARLARERNVGWVIVKRNLQLQEEPLAFHPQLLKLLARDYEPVESLNNYDIYRRR